MDRQERKAVMQRELLELMAACDMNRTEVGRRMHYTRTAVNYHMDKILDATGKDPRTFYGLCELLGYVKKEE